MQDDSSSPAVPRDILIFACMLLLFVVGFLSPVYVATATPTEASEASGSGKFTTMWKTDTVVTHSVWANATPFLGLENSTESSFTESSSTPSIFEPSGDDVFHQMSRASRIQMFLLAIFS